MRFFAQVMLIMATALMRAQAGSAVVAELPFQFLDGLLWVSVTVSEAPKPLNFLVDTGAGVSAINLSTARKLGFSLGEEVKVRGVGSTTLGYWPQRLSANIGGVTLPKEYLVVDLGRLCQGGGCALDGLLGADFFRDKIVQIDFVQQKLRLLSSSETMSASEVLPLSNRGQALQVPVEVNGRRAEWFRLDTGCASFLQWVSGSQPLTGLSHHIAIGLAQQSIPQTKTNVRLGSQQFDSVPTGLHQSRIFQGENGLLGTGLLARFARVTIDCKTHRLLLESRR